MTSFKGARDESELMYKRLCTIWVIVLFLACVAMGVYDLLQGVATFKTDIAQWELGIQECRNNTQDLERLLDQKDAQIVELRKQKCSVA